MLWSVPPSGLNIVIAPNVQDDKSQKAKLKAWMTSQWLRPFLINFFFFLHSMGLTRFFPIVISPVSFFLMITSVLLNIETWETSG